MTMALKMNGALLGELFEDFYTLTRIRIVIFDDSFHEIYAYPATRCDFCNITRADPECDRRCVESDRRAFERCRETRQIYIYRCHAGLTEAAAPILSDGTLLGYLMFGQIVDEKEKHLPPGGIASALPKDAAALEAACRRLTYKSPEQIRAAAKIMEACSCYLWLSNLVSARREKLTGRLDALIRENFAGSLDVPSLCDALGVSRSRLYAAVGHCGGRGVACYIRDARIREAQRLLLKTAMKVAEIGAAVGMPDYNYFSKVFKKAVGMSPREYRARAGE